MAGDQDGRRSPEEKNGSVVTLLGEAMRKVVAPEGGRQTSLFEAGDALPDDDRAGEAREAGRPGRPPGARNKATEELRAFVRSKYGDPGLKLMEMIFADPKALAQALGAESAWEVRQKQMEWAMKMVPFFWAAMPQEHKVTAKGAFAVAMIGTPGGPAGDQIVTLDPLAALQEFQRLSDEDGGQSNVDRSDVEPASSTGPKG